jgi:hypothetical protein
MEGNVATRKELTRARRIDDQTIEQLCEGVRAGLPHRQPQSQREERGYADLIYLSSGRFYPVTDFIKTRDDRETALELWAALREELILAHIEREPRSRPWAWWHLEERELRREGETEASYLKRLRLLLPGEKAAE